MTVNIQAPNMGESISEATVASWAKKEGDMVKEDELIAELETDKINLEVIAPASGKLSKVMVGEGDTVTVGQVMGEIDESASAGESASAPQTEEKVEQKSGEEPVSQSTSQPAPTSVGEYDLPLSPAVQRLVSEHSLDPSVISGTGKDGRLTKGDVLAYLENPQPKEAPKNIVEEKPQPISETSAETPAVKTPSPAPQGEWPEERVKMSRLRQTIAGRLKTAQNNAAMLTTYNEVDLGAVMKLRKEHKESFEKKHGVKLGFMSFFTKAVVAALKDWPALNAEIDGDELVYKKYYNIGMAVSTEKGLVVPVIKNADQLGFADIEKSLGEFAQKGRDGKLMPDDMTGGTFSITNGGVFGSMMSMPILNYPQVGILGMHAIQERPVVRNGEIVIRPMMYLALTYDHRIVDGREAVSCLKQIKEALEDPGRLLLDL